MARTGSETTPTPADGQQMDGANDPAETARLDAAAPAEAMASRRQRLTGSAAGVGSVGFEEDGAFDIGAADDPHDDAVTDDPPPPGRG